MEFIFCILFGIVKFDFNHNTVVLEGLLCSLRKSLLLCLFFYNVFGHSSFVFLKMETLFILLVHHFVQTEMTQ